MFKQNNNSNEAPIENNNEDNDVKINKYKNIINIFPG